jgi:ribonuclease BN (tRNA processing enzyme)
VLSHLHGDHVLDLAALQHQTGLGAATQPSLYGPPGTRALAAAVAGYFDAIASAAGAPRGLVPPPRSITAAVEIAGDDEREICGFDVRSIETPHAPDLIAAARRFSAGGLSVVYSGDTQPNPAGLVPLAAGAGLLIHECYSEEWLLRSEARGPGPAGGRLREAVIASHSEVLQAAAIARDAGVRRLALTHLSRGEDPEELQAKAATVFGGEIFVARDGLVLEL